MKDKINIKHYSLKSVFILILSLIAGFLFFIGNNLFSELILFSVLVILFLLMLSLRNKAKKSNGWFIMLSIIALMITFTTLHLLFCYQIGFPASVNQDAESLELTSSDWLGFLGDYLSFSGSLLMAFIVYRQSRIIDDFTISEYKPAIGIKIIECKKSTEVEHYNGRSILQKDSKQKGYYTVLPYHKKLQEVEYESFSTLIYAEITNYSKSTLHQFSFHSLEIQETKENGNHFIYEKDKKNEVTDIRTHLFPGETIDRCFLLKTSPKKFGISLMTISFCYSDIEQTPLDVKILVSKSPGEKIRFVNI